MCPKRCVAARLAADSPNGEGIDMTETTTTASAAQLAPDEQELVDLLRQLPPGNRRLLVDIAAIVVEGVRRHMADA